MKLFLILAAITIAAACSNEKKADNKPDTGRSTAVIDSLLVTDSSWGLIKRTTDFAALTALYGRQYVKDERICGPECVDSVDVTILYPGQPNEAVIYWNDSAYHKSISFIRCGGDSAAWHTAAGIKTGSGFSEVLKLNGRQINFSGFGWDYGGSITSYNKGTLETSNIHYEIDLKGEGAEGLWGDIELNTGMPVVKQHLSEMSVTGLTLTFK